MQTKADQGRPGARAAFVLSKKMAACGLDSFLYISASRLRPCGLYIYIHIFIARHAPGMLQTKKWGAIAPRAD